MKILSFILLVCLTISCSDNEHKSKNKKGKAGVTPQGDIHYNDNSYDPCRDDVILGSFAYKVKNYYMQMMWNKTNQAKYYQVVIMDRYDNVYKSPLITNNYFDVQHSAVDHRGNRLKDVMPLHPNSWYWVDIYAYDRNRKPVYGHEYQHIKRWIDIQLVPGHKHLEQPFCNYTPYGL